MITFLLIYLCWILSLFGIGYLVSWLFLPDFKSSLAVSLFRNIFLGYIIVVIVYAAVCTGGKTINMALLFILIIALYEIRKVKVIRPSTSIDYRQLIPVFFFLLLSFWIGFIAVYDPQGFLGYYYHKQDYIITAKVSYYISQLGYENKYLNLNALDPYYHKTMAYHYFDTWGAACVSRFFGINPYLSLRIVIYPTFYFLYFVGLLSLFSKISWRAYLLAFLLMFMGGFFIQGFENISFLKQFSPMEIYILHPGVYKLSYFYVFFLGAYLLYQSNLKTLAVLCLAALTIANIITLLPVFTVLFLVLLLGLLTHAFIRTETMRLVVYLGTLLVCIAAFYSFTAGTVSDGSLNILAFGRKMGAFFIDNNNRIRFNILIISGISIVLLYFPALFLAIIFPQSFRLKSFYRDSCKLFLLGGVFFSSFYWCLLYEDYNAYQIFQNLAFPLLNAGLSIWIIKLYEQYFSKEGHRFKLWVSATLLVFMIGGNMYQLWTRISIQKPRIHSNSYLACLQKSIPKDALVASLKSEETMIDLHAKDNICYTLGDYLFLMDKNISIVNVGDLNTPIDTSSLLHINRSIAAIQDGIYFRYSALAENQGLSQDKLLLKFLTKYHIRYMILSKNAVLPQGISEKAASIVVDSISKERFLVLDLPVL